MFPTVPRCLRRSICTSATRPSSRTEMRVSRSDAETRSSFSTGGVYAEGGVRPLRLLEVPVDVDREVNRRGGDVLNGDGGRAAPGDGNERVVGSRPAGAEADRARRRVRGIG